MKLHAIVTNRNLPLRLKAELIKEKLVDLPDEVAEFIAYRLPKRIIYWAYIRVGSAQGNIRSNEIVTDVTYTEILSRMDKK